MTTLLGLFAQGKGATQLDVGVLFLLAGFVSTLLMIPSGILSQIFGKRKLILISTVISAISLFSLTLAPTWQWLVLGASGFNIGFALFIPARMNLVADYSTRLNRATVFGIVNMSWPVGTIYGPTMAGVLVDSFSWNSAFYFAAITELASLFFALRLSEGREAGTVEGASGGSVGWEFMRTRVTFLFAMHLLTSLGISTVDPLLPLYLHDRFGVSETGIGIFYSLSAGFATLLGQIPAGIVGDRYGRRRLILASTAAILPLYILCALADTYLLLLIFYIGIHAAWSLTWPTTMALLIDMVPTGRRGLAVGVRQTVIRLGSDFGPSLGGYLSPFPLPFYASAMLTAVSIPFILLIREKR
jgi:MFS family permease